LRYRNTKAERRMKRWQFAAGAVLVLAVLVFLLGRSGHQVVVTAPPTPVVAQGGMPPGAAPLRARDTVPAVPVPFAYQHVHLNTAGDVPEACLVFSAPLSAAADAHYGDYVKLSPTKSPALRVNGSELCVGGLSFGNSYTLTILKGLAAADGARLAADVELPLALGDKPKLIDIAGDGFLLPRETAHGLTIQTVNVRRLRVHILRMSDRLLPAKRRDSGYGGISFANGSLNTSGGGGYFNIRGLLRDAVSMVWSGTMDIEEDHNRTVQTAFPLTQVIRQGQVGAYLVVAQDDDRAVSEANFTAAMKARGDGDEDYGSYSDWDNMAAHWVISTDMALTTYAGTDGLTVSVRSLASAAPIAGVRLTLLAMGQDLLGEAVSDAGGLAHFAPGLLRGEGAQAAAFLTAHGAGDDFNILDLSRPAFDFSDRGVTGRPSPAPLQAFLYTDRGIYRPGHMVQAMALLRDRLGDSAGGMPLTFVLRRPNGMEAKRFTQAPQAAGGFLQPITLSPTAARGTWSLEALADPAGSPVGRASFEVQDYVPQQLKVALGKLPAFAAPGQQLALSVQGDFLYGAPAAGLHGEAELRVVADPEPVSGAKGFVFGLADEKVDEKLTTIPLPPADAHGASQASAKVDVTEGLQAPRKLLVAAGLFEPSGRIVTDKKELKLHLRPVLIGLRLRFDDDRTDEGRDAPIDVRVFDPTGNPIARPGLRWRVIWQEQIFDWFENYGSWHWHYHTRDRQIGSGTLDVGATVPASIVRQYDWGDYKLVVEDPATGVASSVVFHAGWGNSADQADIPDKVQVASDGAAVADGGTAKLRIKGPFAGHAQLVIANDRVLETRELDVGKDGAEISLTRSPDWGAGVYALVTLYRPLASGTPHQPVRAVGLTWIGADTAARTLAVSFKAPAQMRPQNDLAVQVHVTNVPAGQKAFVTLAAVDEGILQRTRFQNPDPVGFLFGKRALGVSMRDDYGKLLDGSADPGRIQGGDEGLGGAGLPVVSTRTVAMFSGIVALDGNGDAVAHFAVPDFQGQVRLMAVAYADGSVGEAAASVIVRDPVVADIAMPRFLGSGDDAQLAVQLHDVDGPGGTYKLVVKAGGAWRLAGADTIAETLQPGERKSAAIAVHGAAEGVGTLAAELTGPDGLDVHRSWEISVRGPHYPITLQQAAWQNAGASYSIDPALLGAFVPGSLAVSLGYSGFEGIDVPSLLQSLWRYPYGCTEQLASTAFPLLYANDPVLLGHAKGDRATQDRVQSAIDTILERQGADGEFGLWRAEDFRASTWLNVYVLDFLTHAKDAGFTVEPNAMRLGLAWLERASRGEAQEHVGDSDGNMADETKAYALYVLARTGRADIGELRRWRDTVLRQHMVARAGFWMSGEDKDVFEPLSLGHIAGALALMGDRARADDTFRMAIDNLGYREWPGWWFYYLYATPTRDIAGLLAIAADVDMPPVVQQLTGRLHSEKFDPRWLDTQSTAALLSAAHALNKSAASIKLDVNGTVAMLGATPALAPTAPQITAGYRVRNDGDRPVWRTLSLTGAPIKAAIALSDGYRIDKTYFSLDGEKLDPAHVRQNDRVIVMLHGVSQDSDGHRSVVVDLLPAGWEIENAVGTSNQYSFLGPISAARVREARDDRFVAAFDLGDELLRRPGGGENDTDDKKPHLEDNEFRMAYVARAITPGHFTLPEAVVQDMYKPQVMGRTASGITDVAAR
jgi:alpha-2-macroglobulin